MRLPDTKHTHFTGSTLILTKVATTTFGGGVVMMVVLVY